MNLMAESIIFNGKMLPVGFVMCSFESSDTTRETGIKLTANKSAITPFRNKTNLYSVQYEDVLKFSISLIKCVEIIIVASELKLVKMTSKI